MRVRVATQYDEPAVLDVLRADGDATGRQPSKARLAAVRAVLRSPRTLTLVADDDGAVVGVLLAELGPGHDGVGPVEPGMLHLPLLCVAPQHRRRGAGRLLLRRLLSRFEHVSTWTSDDGVRALLEGEGFTATGRRAEVRGTAACQLVHRSGAPATPDASCSSSR